MIFPMKRSESPVVAIPGENQCEQGPTTRSMVDNVEHRRSSIMNLRKCNKVEMIANKLDKQGSQ